jgi:ABC-type transport system involved in multi-copper enzyme maturation permease subunit
LLGPIFNREFVTIPRRPRHHATRVVYLGTLWVLAVTAWLALQGWQKPATLGDTARFGPLLFRVLTYVQLVLFLFFAALSSASAVAQEKDRRTFVLLLMTDLSNIEIVVGKIMGSLLPILFLFVGSIPLFYFLLLLGGVGPHQVIEALLVMAAASLVAGSLGGVMALWRERTFQSLALTVLFLVLYLCLVQALALVPGLGRGASAFPLVAWLDPFQALQSSHQFITDRSVLAAYFRPAYGFAAVMVGFTVVLNLWGVWRLRVWNPSGEPIIQRERAEDTEETIRIEKEVAALSRASSLEGLQPGKALASTRSQDSERRSVHAAPGKARPVGANPILWREIATRAYGRRPLLIKCAYGLALAMICYYALWIIGFAEPLAAAHGLVPVGILSLLLVAAQAVTAITSERDTGSLDLLLVTDLSPKEFIFGKLGGICWNTKEYLIPPLLLTGIYAYHQALATPPEGHPELAPTMNLTSFLCICGTILVLLAFAMVLGVHVALRTPNSRAAITNTLSTIFFLSVGTGVCMALILISGRFEYQWGSFVLFLVAGIGGFWWVLSGDRPSTALTLASWLCPLSILYVVMAVLVARPGSQESADPIGPFLVLAFVFGFAISAMLVPLLSEFDVAMGRTSAGAD